MRQRVVWNAKGLGLVLVIVLASAVAAQAAPVDGVAFDGKTAYQVDAKALRLNPKAITVATWVKLRTHRPRPVFLNCGQPGDVFTFYILKATVRMLVGHQTPKYAHADAPAPKLGTWAHYAGTYDGQTIKIYLNGKLTASCEAGGAMSADTGDLFIGALDESERFLDGWLEDVRLWRRTLTDQEIAAVATGKDDAGLGEALAARWTRAGLEGETWTSLAPASLAAKRVEKAGVILNRKDDGYRGVWYYNQRSDDEYKYKYSGGLGTYCAKHIPHAWYVKQADRTFFTYGGAKKGTNNHLVHMVSYYDHKTGMVPRPTILLDKRTTDAHDNPVIGVDDRGTVWIFSSSHGTSRPSYISKSVRPCAVDAFELVWTGNFSYPQPWFFPGKGFLFIHTHYTKGRSNCMMTSPDGATWSKRRFLSRIAHGHYQISRPYRDKKVGIAFNYHPDGKGLNWRTNLYYMESDDFGTTWKTAAGQTLRPMLSTVDNPALVHDYESKGLNVYMKDITFDAKGRPVVLYVTSKGYESGPKNMPRTWTTARWTGSAWDIQGGDIISDNNYDTGAVYVESDDQWRIIGPTQTGPQPFNPGGEVAMWVSRDQGKHWKMTRQMTRNSKYNHTYVRRPVNAHPDFYGFWADGHGRQPSDSRLYFCNRAGDVFRLPVTMKSEFQKPERVE